jgi:hypothetical protein
VTRLSQARRVDVTNAARIAFVVGVQGCAASRLFGRACSELRACGKAASGQAWPAKKVPNVRFVA